MTTPRWLIRGFAVALVSGIFFAGFGNAVLHLWNGLMPEIFGLRAITYPQAIGLLALSWLLFGGPRGVMGGGRLMRGNMGGRLRHMPPEERAKIREALERGGRHCH